MTVRGCPGKKHVREVSDPVCRFSEPYFQILLTFGHGIASGGGSSYLQMRDFEIGAQNRNRDARKRHHGSSTSCDRNYVEPDGSMEMDVKAIRETSRSKIRLKLYPKAVGVSYYLKARLGRKVNS